MKKKCCDHNPLSDIEAMELLSTSGINRTKAKLSILKALSKASSPISVTEIHHLLGESEHDISTIFRTIGQFKDKGLVREVILGEDFSRYEYISVDDQAHGHHHHHVRCRSCGEIKQIEKCDLSIFEKLISKLGYKEMEHFLEFTGLCSKCS